MAPQACDDVRPLLDVEGYTQVGMARSLRITDCGKHRKYIVVEMIDGRRICTPCLDEDVVELSVKLIEHYSKNIELVAGK